MAYGDFLQRENVYKVIVDTLSQYYSAEIKLHNKREITNKKRTMYCFPRIGIIIPSKPSKEVFLHVKREYRITYSIFKKLLMNMYIDLAFMFPFIFCEKIIELPFNIENKQLFIEPGNKKIKLIDYRKKTIENIVKSGFKTDWMEKEIEYRTKNIKEYIIPLKVVINGYVEPLHKGYGFVRLTNIEKERLKEKVDSIINEYSSHEYTIEAKKYLYGLLDKIKKSEKRTQLNEFEYLINLIARICSCTESMEIQMSLSHGDLQQGNLFYDYEEEKIYLIDWETWDYRSSWYDKFLFYYGFRNSKRLKENFENYISNEGKKIFKVKTTRRQLIIAFLVFYVEDIVWQVNEMSVLPMTSISTGISEYVKEENLHYIDMLIDEVTV